MQRNLWIVFLGLCVLFVFLIGRLMYIEYSSGARYEKIILGQQEYNSRIIPFQRGNIVDAKGTVLATSIDVYNVILDCKVLNANKDSIESTIKHVTESFPQIKKEDLEEYIEKQPTNQYITLAKKISYEDMQAFTAKMEDEENRGEIAGIWFEKVYKRKYPYKSLAASLIGFVGSGGDGAIGVENSYNAQLNGTNGRSYGYLNTDSDVERTVVQPENGDEIVLTVDANIQSIVEKSIKKFEEDYRSGDAHGSLNTATVVMNPNSGEIYAMANFPTFNLNKPRDLSKVYTKGQLAAMKDDERLDALNNLWQNFCVTRTYEPGSTFKPFTVACGLETGCLHGDEHYICDGYEKIGPYDVHCVNRNGHGELDIRKALMESCNDALMQMSYVIGSKNFAKYQNLFGFGQKTNIDVPGEARTDSLIYDEKALGQRINLATNSFGQNFNTTMIQLGAGFCSLINDGVLYQPHVVSRVVDDSGNVVSRVDPVVMKKTVSKSTSAQIRDYLHSVVKDGTGSGAGVDGYAIGGKTGTAQKQPRGTGKYLVSFIGFAPVDDPQVVVYTIVDEPNVEDQAHSAYAQEITKRIFKQILPYLGVEPEKAKKSKKKKK